jgi:hypothetical protein
MEPRIFITVFRGAHNWTTDWVVSVATLISTDHETENIKYKFTVEESPVFGDITPCIPFKVN